MNSVGLQRSNTEVTLAREGDLSPGLRALIARDPVEQAAFWKSCVTSTQGELDALEALSFGSVTNDVLIRYFDPSPRSINKVFDTASRLQKDQNTKDVLHKDGFYTALSDFYAVFESVTTAEEKQAMMTGSNKEFERVCETVAMPCNRDCFGYSLRRLRIAILLRHFDLEGGHQFKHQGQIHHVDYDTENIWSPFVSQNSQKSFDLSVIEPQVSGACFSEYLFNQKGRSGDVHWEHVDHPNMELILAIGQVWCLPAAQLALMFNLEKVQSQISVPDKAALSKNRYAWSFMILPTIYLDKYSRESLQCYRNWYEQRRDPQQKNNMSAKPPRVHVAATYSNLAMMWTSEAVSSLVTVSTETHYIGKWNTDKAKHKRTFFKSLLAKITCEGTGYCCSRRRKAEEDEEHIPHEGKPLLGKDEDLEKSMKTPRRWQSTELQQLFDDNEAEDKAVFGEKATNKETSTIKFEDRFDQLLTNLQQPHSVLRLGSHWDLLLRICANRTHEYLDVLETYEAAIARLTFLLDSHKTDNKDNLIAKIEQIKMEVSKLEMLVNPFANCVVDDLSKHMEMMTGGHRTPPQMKEIQSNILAFTPKCKSIVDSCADLTVQYDRATGDKMNNILNILTFITFVITPMQLMTGIYGMNWDHMPELHWSKGYHFFWVLSVFLSIVFALVLVCLQRSDKD